MTIPSEPCDKLPEVNASVSGQSGPTALYMFTQDLTCVVGSTAVLPRDTPGQQFPKCGPAKQHQNHLGTKVKMQIHGLHCSPAELETLDPATCVLLSPQGGSGACSTLRHCSRGSLKTKILNLFRISEKELRGKIYTSLLHFSTQAPRSYRGGAGQNQRTSLMSLLQWIFSFLKCHLTFA